MVTLGLIAASLLAACGGPPDTSIPTTPTVELSPQEAAGKRLFSQYCGACHSIVGEAAIVGPAMAGIATRAETRIEGMSAHDYLIESILDPGAYLVPGFDNLMPSTWGTTLTGEEMDAIIAFMLTLK
ncbi:MAG: c-type cytochrome [Anaerolineales bacterium]|nr:cytochrome c [Anaerolineales bacterium]MCL4258473.1 c-type cytochrome [Anaerolineales bacterium]QYK50211.1 MAG: cytochrome c [Anaerolineales bacterium]